MNAIQQDRPWWEESSPGSPPKCFVPVLGAMIRVKFGQSGASQLARVEGFTPTKIKVRAFNGSRERWYKNLRPITREDIIEPAGGAHAWALSKPLDNKERSPLPKL